MLQISDDGDQTFSPAFVIGMKTSSSCVKLSLYCYLNVPKEELFSFNSTEALSNYFTLIVNPVRLFCDYKMCVFK